MRNLIERLGPGLLYAAAAVGVSHLVQSTRAGAMYGLDLFIVIILIHFIKYPFFWIAQAYYNQTELSLIEGYSKIHKSLPILVAVIILLIMFIVQAAVTLVTSGLLANILSIQNGLTSINFTVLLIATVFIFLQKFNLFNQLIKYVIFLLTISTIFAVIFALPNINKLNIFNFKFNIWNITDFTFLMAFIGWMPAPMDVPIWQSLWIKEKKTKDKNFFDFKTGYWGTAVLALLFLSLGALIMNPANIKFESGAIGFTKQIIDLYAMAIGDDFKFIISIAAFTTMLSTTLTCLDAFPRVLTKCIQETRYIDQKKSNQFFVSLLAIGSFILLEYFLTDMKALIDFATIVSFLISPLFAILSYKLIKEIKSPKKIIYLSQFGILFFSIFSFVYLYTLFC